MKSSESLNAPQSIRELFVRDALSGTLVNVSEPYQIILLINQQASKAIDGKNNRNVAYCH